MTTKVRTAQVRLPQVRTAQVAVQQDGLRLRMPPFSFADLLCIPATLDTSLSITQLLYLALPVALQVSYKPISQTEELSVRSRLYETTRLELGQLSRLLSSLPSVLCCHPTHYGEEGGKS